MRRKQFQHINKASGGRLKIIASKLKIVFQINMPETISEAKSPKIVRDSEYFAVDVNNKRFSSPGANGCVK